MTRPSPSPHRSGISVYKKVNMYQSVWKWQYVPSGLLALSPLTWGLNAGCSGTHGFGARDCWFESHCGASMSNGVGQ